MIVFQRKIDAKTEEKALKKNWKNWTARSACNPGLVHTLGQQASLGLVHSLAQGVIQAQREEGLRGSLKARLA